MWDRVDEAEVVGEKRFVGEQLDFADEQTMGHRHPPTPTLILNEILNARTDTAHTFKTATESAPVLPLHLLIKVNT